MCKNKEIRQGAQNNDGQVNEGTNMENRRKKMRYITKGTASDSLK